MAVIDSMHGKTRPSLRRAGLGALALLTLLGGGTATGQTINMKLASNTIRDPVHEYLKEFDTRIEARTGGRISASIYPASQLGAIPRMIEGTQLGTIELFITASGFFKSVNIAYEALDAPGLFQSMEHAQATFSDPAVAKPFLDLAGDKGLRGISFFAYGPTSYITRGKALRRLEDFKGLKFRVLATSIERGVMEALGATGVPIPLGEVLPSLQRGVIDGVRSSIVVTAGLKFFTVAKHITTVNDTMIPTIAMVSTAWLGKLPSDLRQAVLDVGAEMSDVGFRAAVSFDRRAEKMWRDNGAEVIDLSPDDQAEFMRRVREVGERVLGNHRDETTQKLYAVYKATAEKHRPR